MANIRFLKDLRLSNNSLTGPIPTSFYEMEFLQELHLDNNDMDGELPQSAVPLYKDLQELSISGNKFEGSFPVELLEGTFRISKCVVCVNFGLNGIFQSCCNSSFLLTYSHLLLFLLFFFKQKSSLSTTTNWLAALAKIYATGSTQIFNSLDSKSWLLIAKSWHALAVRSAGPVEKWMMHESYFWFRPCSVLEQSYISYLLYWGLRFLIHNECWNLGEYIDAIVQ